MKSMMYPTQPRGYNLMTSSNGNIFRLTGPKKLSIKFPSDRVWCRSALVRIALVISLALEQSLVWMNISGATVTKLVNGSHKRIKFDKITKIQQNTKQTCPYFVEYWKLGSIVWKTLISLDGMAIFTVLFIRSPECPSWQCDRAACQLCM